VQGSHDSDGQGLGGGFMGSDNRDRQRVDVSHLAHVCAPGVPDLHESFWRYVSQVDVQAALALGF